VALGFALCQVIARYWLLRLRGPLSLERRALWMQSSSQNVLACLNVRYRVEGELPTHGLVVSNHLSYLDVPILLAAKACFFVAKSEIASWPFFGRMGTIGGTIFLNRSSRASAQSVADVMVERLKLSIPIPVLLFPEGTSTDGSEVLRFHSRLIDPAIRVGAPITPAALRYLPEGGLDERDLCWFGDAAFMKHLWKLLGAGGFEAEVRFGAPRVYTDRRKAAEETRAEVTAMREEGALILQ
jgi:1-acyl-sn-glycerol-3-phosphate acyltransferase